MNASTPSGPRVRNRKNPLPIRRIFKAIGIVLLLPLLALAFSQDRTVRTHPSAPIGGMTTRGVSLAGAEFGFHHPEFSNDSPGVFGKDYTHNSEAVYAYFASRGIHTFRLPLRWERLQPRLGEPLNSDELNRLKVAVGWAKRHGGKVLLDLHNYGRYRMAFRGRLQAWAIGEDVNGAVPVSRAHFIDLWLRLSQAFRQESAVYAFGLMNEPEALSPAAWKSLSQETVTSLRAAGDRKFLLVSGAGWASTETFPTVHGLPWIEDPINHFAYDAHCYLDATGTGQYVLSFEEEFARDARLKDRPAQRLLPFARWCRTQGVRGFVGEFGVPRDEERWLPLLKEMVALMDQNHLEGCYWAAGDWWGKNPLSLQPRKNYRQDAPPLQVLLQR